MDTGEAKNVSIASDIDLQPLAARLPIRLRTLIRLRWMAIAGQFLAITVTAFGMGFSFPWHLCLVLVAAAAALNLFLQTRFKFNHRVQENAAFGILAFDVFQLGLLLYLTGGLQNPFAILLMAPVIVSSTTMSLRRTALLGFLAVANATIIAIYYLPLPWYDGQTIMLPPLLIGGTWAAIAITLPFTVLYSFRVAEEARKLADALNATEFVLQREQHLSALDGLAAAAAHELGTPLATIALVSKEMLNEMKPDDGMFEDAKLLRAQAERCREILQKLTSLSTETDKHLGGMPFHSLIEEVVAPHRDFGIDIDVELAGDDDDRPVSRRNPAIMYGLGNLVENAVDFANEKVTVSARWDDAEVVLLVVDDGPGFSPEILAHVGEPFVTSRRRPGKAREQGMGLGLFIAKTLLERNGATIEFGNRKDKKSGAEIVIRWSRTAMETDALEL